MGLNLVFIPVSALFTTLLVLTSPSLYAALPGLTCRPSRTCLGREPRVARRGSRAVVEEN